MNEWPILPFKQVKKRRHSLTLGGITISLGMPQALKGGIHAHSHRTWAWCSAISSESEVVEQLPKQSAMDTLWVEMFAAIDTLHTKTAQPHSPTCQVWAHNPEPDDPRHQSVSRDGVELSWQQLQEELPAGLVLMPSLLKLAQEVCHLASLVMAEWSSWCMDCAPFSLPLACTQQT